VSGVERLLLRDQQASARLADTLATSRLQPLARLIAHTGDSPLWFLAGVLIWFVGSRDVWPDSGETLRRAGITIVVLVPVLAALSFGLKALFRRARPPGERGLLYVRFDAHAFPSSHAVRMGGLAAALALLTPPWLAALLVVWALLIAVARVSLGIHYLLDVSAGLLLGAACGLAVAPMLLRFI